MPLIALNKATNQRIDITKIGNPRVALKANEIVCPVCGHPMMMKTGLVKRAHFAHMPGREDCPYAEYSRGETPEHRMAKELVRDRVSEWFAEYTTAVGELEVYIPEVMHARNRIADVLFTFPGGWRVAHEIQLASITTDELDKRTDDYASQGIDVFWWFGRDAIKQPSNIIWSKSNYGFVLKIHILDQQPSIDTVLHSTDADYRLAGGNSLPQPPRTS